MSRESRTDEGCSTARSGVSDKTSLGLRPPLRKPTAGPTPSDSCRNCTPRRCFFPCFGCSTEAPPPPFLLRFLDLLRAAGSLALPVRTGDGRFVQVDRTMCNHDGGARSSAGVCTGCWRTMHPSFFAIAFSFTSSFSFTFSITFSFTFSITFSCAFSFTVTWS